MDRRLLKICIAAIAVYGMSLGISVSPAAAASPVGLWYAEGGAAQVEIFPCSDALCGRVAWLRSPLDEDGCELRDSNNPETALRRRAVVGLQVLNGLRQEDDGGISWVDGEIYDPASGRTYSCSAQMEGENKLSLRGYVLGIRLLGRTTVWTRVGAIQTKCSE